MLQLDPYVVSVDLFIQQQEIDKRKYDFVSLTTFLLRTIVKIFEFYIPFIQVFAVQNKDLKKCCKKYPIIQ